MPFLRVTTPIWGTRDLPGRFKEWKACLVEIGQTADKLETNARANFLMAENLAYIFAESCLSFVRRTNAVQRTTNGVN